MLFRRSLYQYRQHETCLLWCTSHRAIKNKAMHTQVCLACWFLWALAWFLSNSSCALKPLPLFPPPPPCFNMPRLQSWHSDSNKQSGNSSMPQVSLILGDYFCCLWDLPQNTKLCTVLWHLRTDPAWALPEWLVIEDQDFFPIYHHQAQGWR